MHKKLSLHHTMHMYMAPQHLMEMTDWLHTQATVPIERNNWCALVGQYGCQRKENLVLAMNQTPVIQPTVKDLK